MSMNYTAWAISQDKYKRLDKLVLIEMCNAAATSANAFSISFGEVADLAGISRRKVIDIVAMLKADGVLSVTRAIGYRGDNDSNIYKINTRALEASK